MIVIHALPFLFALHAALEPTRAIVEEIRKNDRTFVQLKELVSLGHRFAGSSGEKKAISWVQEKMKSLDLKNVQLQPVEFPGWKRGRIEKGTFETTPLSLTALGMSVGTPKGGIKAPVIEVQGLEEVAKLGDRVRGKIIFYNRALDPAQSDKFAAYGAAIDQRVSGASRAAAHGAVGVLIRSLGTLIDDDHPHTGVLRYDPAQPAIPAAALSTRAANQLSKKLKTNPNGEFHLELSARLTGQSKSANVLGEIPGSMQPEEVVVLAAHLDSWDLAPSAHDDAVGVVQVLEAMRALKAIKPKPRRTIRAVLYTAEEIGVWGGIEYARIAKAGAEKHIGAIESDGGGARPEGFNIHATRDVWSTLKRWVKPLELSGVKEFKPGHAGADIAPLEALGAVTFGLRVDSSKYFDYHHSALDQLTVVEPEGVRLGAEAMAVLAYLISEHGI